MHEITNSLLRDARNKLHPELLLRVRSLAQLGEYGELCGWDYDAIQLYFQKHPHIETAYNWLLQHRVSDAMPTAFAVPYLHPEFCKQLVLEVHDKGFAPNEYEDQAYQIDELVTEHEVPELFSILQAVFDIGMRPVLMCSHMQEPAEVRSIQFAKYNPDGVSHGNWHHDADSDQTVVVALNTGEFTGGGTELALDLNHCIEVPPLPVGHALIFLGKTTLHRGLYVPEGDRMLLVHWTELKGPIDYSEVSIQ